MKHLAIICSEFFKFAVDRDWWKNLSEEEQKQYILKHRKTRLRPTPGSNSAMNRVLKSIPQEWKKTLISKGVGKDSSIEQLPDALRPRYLKKVFDDNPSTQAIVAFKSGTPITDLQPEFIITNSYEPQKYECKRYKDDEGNILTGFDAYVHESKQRSPRWDRRLHRTVQRPGYKKTDLRMSKIVEKLPDQAYTVYAITTDEVRLKQKQVRSDSTDKSSQRDIVSKLVAREIKPVYDYYADKMNILLQKLNSEAIPEFSEVVNAPKYSSVMKDISEITSEIDKVRQKLSSLTYQISRVKNIDLPRKDVSYSQNQERSKERAHELFEAVRQLKKQFEDDFYKAERFKKRQAIDAIKNNDVQESIDTLREIQFNDLADKVKSISDEGKLSDEKDNLIKEILETSKSE